METLYPHRIWNSAYCQQTILKDKDGKVKAIFNSSLQQPKKGSPNITLKVNGKEKIYNLSWKNIK